MTETLEEEVLTQDDMLTRATQAMDVDALDRLYADDLTMTGVLGELCGFAHLSVHARRSVGNTPALADD